MGFYDTIGEYQVKCFKHPILRVDDKTIDIGAECGAFKFFRHGDEVPYRTPYCNLGENFMIFDIRRTFWGDNFEGFVHIIENGRYVTSEHYTQLSDSHPIYLVIDNYGSPLSIKTKEDFLRIIEEEVASAKAYMEATKTYMIQLGGIPLTNVCRIREQMQQNGWTEEFVLQQIELNDAARLMAYADTIEPFRKKWYDAKKYSEIYGGVPIGLIYDLYKKNPDKYDWPNIVVKLEEDAIANNTSLKVQIERYLIWAESQLIKIDDDFHALFPAKGDS